MDKKIKKILRENNFWDYNGNQYRYGWKKFWSRKLSLYNKYSYWRFILATPAYLIIFVLQLFGRKQWNHIKPPEWLQYEYLRKKYPDAVEYYPYTNMYRLNWDKIAREDWLKDYASSRLELEAHDTWIKTLTDDEQKELVALWNENEKNREDAHKAVLEEIPKLKNVLIDNSPAGFYPDGSLPGRYKK